MKPNRLLTSLLLFTAACATPVDNGNLRQELEGELATLRHTQAVFRAENTGTHVFDFDGQGRVTVREISLDGFPGNTYVRCRFHYQNRTTRPIVQAWVSLDVLDARGRVVSTQTCCCIVPAPIPLARGSYYSDELRTPTYDVHLQPGWSWRVRCVADPVVEDEPLDPPVPERKPREVPPMTIKDRSNTVIR